MEILWVACSPANWPEHAVSVILAVIIVFVLYASLNKRLHSAERSVLLILFLYHALFTFLYLVYANGVDDWRVDSMKFFDRACGASSWPETYGTAIKAITFMVYPLVNILDMNFLSVSLIFSFVGFLGLSFCYIATARFLESNSQRSFLLVFIFFWPSMHFWTAAIGKDSWSVFALGVVLLCSMNWRRYAGLLLISFLIILHVRPYLFFIFGFAFVLAQATSKGGSGRGSKFVLVFLITIMIFPAMGFFKEHLRVEEIGMSALEERYQDRLDKQVGDSYIDLRDFSLPEKVGAFLFRPLFFDAVSSRAILASVENVMLIIVLLIFLRPYTARLLFSSRQMYVRFNLILVPITLVFMANITPNLGAAFRKKYLVLIPLLITIVILRARLRPK